MYQQDPRSLERESVLPHLTPAERERIVLLMEEASEVVGVCAKILRHGFESANPDEPNSPTNRERLEMECGDLRHAMILMCEKHDMRQHMVHEYAKNRITSVLKWLHHQGPRLMVPTLSETVRHAQQS